jgi:hypothetical protein
MTNDVVEVSGGTWVKYLYNTVKPFGTIKSKQFMVVKQFSDSVLDLDHTIKNHASKSGALSWEITEDSGDDK